jgi:hypothetical protein
MLSRDEEGVEPLGPVLEAWDYAEDLVLTRTLALDPILAAQALQLETVRLIAVVTAGTGGPQGERDRRIVWRQEVPAPFQPAPIEFRLAGASVSQSLTLTTELLIVEATGPSALSPIEPMARVWRETVSTLLDPEIRRFPMETASFAALLAGRPHQGAWYLDWSLADIDRDFMSAVRLYLNSEQPHFVARVGASDEPVMQLLIGSIMIQLCRGLLGTGALSLRLAAEAPESLGGVVAGWLQAAFPNQSLDSIEALSRSNPAIFETSLIAAAGAENADD